MSQLTFDGRVALVTGAGGGLGREYALLLASRGAAVVVNDLGGSRDGSGQSSKAADVVVDEIRKAGGKAVADYNSVEDGEKIVKTAIDNFGRIDIVINNAGILRDKSMVKITMEDWDLIHRIHLRAAFIITKAAWPYFRQQNYGRIIVTASTAGIYGNFGQTNYSSAKIGLIGLSNTFAIEGAKYNIHSNAIVPIAASRLTQDILPENLFEQLKPKYVSPVVAYLCHESCEENGGVFEAAGGWVGKYRWSRAQGKAFIPPDNLTVEAVKANWSKITDMQNSSMPASVHEQMALLHNSLSGGPTPISEAKEVVTTGDDAFRFGADDLILYALSVGANTSDSDNLKYLYEGHEQFSGLPSYGVIPAISSFSDSAMINEALKPYNIELNPTKLVHGEQYLQLVKPIPTSGAFKTHSRVVDVLDKGSGAVLILESDTVDENNEKVCYNQAALFLVGSGNFGGKKMSEKSEVKSVLDAPQRPPDASVVEKTSAEQAALYRLTGDKNPLHIDPAFATMGGFERPILHGLCTYGYVTRHVLKQYAGNDPSKFKSLKARFASSVYPGQTLKTDMWREGNRIFVQTTCVETGKPAITGAYADLTEVLEPQPSKVLTSVTDPLNPSPSELAFDTDDANGLLTDVVFEEIGRRIAMAPELSKKVNGIFTFVIVKDRQEVKVWTMDMKQTPGKLYEGHSKAAPADCVIRITDQDMTALAVGELDPVRAFMTGKLKIKGNLMATQRLQALFELNSAEVYESDSDRNDSGKVSAGAVGGGEKMLLSPGLGESWHQLGRVINSGSSLPSSYYTHTPTINGQDPSNSTKWFAGAYDENGHDNFYFAQGGDGAASGGGGIAPIIDLLFEKWLPTRVDELKELVPVIKTVYQWNILQKGQTASVWTLDLKNGDGAIHRGPPKSGKADCILSIEDENAVKIFEGKEDAMKAFMSGKLKITGNIMAAQKLQQVWADEAEKVRSVLADLKAGKGIGGGAPSAAPAAAPAPAAGAPAGQDPDISSYPATGIKADIFFNIFKNRCHEEPEFMQRLRVAFQFNITKEGKPVCVWTADNKSSKDVLIYRSPPQGIKPDVTATVEDDDLLKILTGRVNPQRLFMMGRVKVKGNIMLLQKLNGLWSEFQKLGKTPELPLIVDVMLEDPLIPGLKSEGGVIECIQRLVRLQSEFVKQAPGYHQVDITDNTGKVVSTWTLNLKDKINFFRGAPKKGAVAPDSKITVDDISFISLVLMKSKIQELVSKGAVKIEGDQKITAVWDRLFTTPTSLKPRL